MTSYHDFLASRTRKPQPHGFEPTDLPPRLFPFQADIVRWACRLGRAAIFADTGLGKTAMQLAWADQVRKNQRNHVLILTPLAVGPQTVEEAAAFGIDGVVLASCQGDVNIAAEQLRGQIIAVTNYQKLSKFDTSTFDGVVLDESQILKNFTGKIKTQLCERFERTPFKLCCTATPAPNDHVELGNHADFLGVMPANEMLSRWFINDQANAGNYRLKGYAASDFWRWVASWACTIGKPSDLGYEDGAYKLPPLEIETVVVDVDITDGAGDRLMRSESLSATQLHKEMRLTARSRAIAAWQTVITRPKDEPAIVWCNTDYEQDELEKYMPKALSVRGSDSDKKKEAALAEFKTLKDVVLITKPSVCGFGLNWQHCRWQVFVGLNYSFEAYYQAVRRCWRFGQTKTVKAFLVQATTEGEILAAVKEKQLAHEEMRRELTSAMTQFWREEMNELDLIDVAEHGTATGDGWTLTNGDCVEGVAKLPDDSVDLSVYSPPFCNLYIYSDSLRDMGNADTDEEFFDHYRFLVKDLLRVTVPGRLTAVHCKDLPLYRGRDGACGLKDFPGQIVKLHEECGWIFHSRVTIWKCPVTERERTNNNGLLHATVVRDSSQCRQGMADYLLVFRKNPTDGNLSTKPIVRPAGFTEWRGDPKQDPRTGAAHPSKFARKPGTKPRITELPDGTKADLTPSVNVWQRYADPVWFDIDQRDVLNYQLGKDNRDEKHICVARGSLVLTRDGHKPIEEVEVGDMVLTHLGRWRHVTGTACNGVKPVVRTTAQGVADLRTTPDHRFWMREIGKCDKQRQAAMRTDPLWIPASNGKGNYINLKLPPIEKSSYSAEEWWVIGNWLGNGHIDTRGRLHISVSHAKAANLIAKLGQRAGFAAVNRTATQISLKDRNARLRNLIARCGRGAGGKRLPVEALSLDSEKAESLLSGYLAADGHYVAKYDRWTASSISRPLLLGMAMVAQRARGVVASVFAGRPAGTSVIEGRTVNTRQDWILSIPPKNLSGFIACDGSWKKVRSVEDAGEAEVWDLEVQDDSSFTVEGCIVHNCPLQLGVIDRTIELWSNPGDLVLSPFAGIGSEGYQSLVQGRRFHGFELKQSYFKIAQQNLARALRERNKPTLFDDVPDEAVEVGAL